MTDENKEKSLEDVLKEMQKDKDANEQKNAEEKKGQEIDNLKEVLSKADSQAKGQEPSLAPKSQSQEKAPQTQQPSLPEKKEQTLSKNVQKLDEIIKNFKGKKESL